MPSCIEAKLSVPLRGTYNTTTSSSQQHKTRTYVTPVIGALLNVVDVVAVSVA